MALDLDLIRTQFPALAVRDNGLPRVYFDNPAGTQVPRQVIERMSDCLIRTNGNLGGHFPTSVAVAAMIGEARQALAAFLNAPDPSEIIFGQNMTSLTFHLARSLGRLFEPGDEIIVTRMDHDANIAPWLMLAEDRGLVIKWLELDADGGALDLDSLDTLLSERTRLLAIGYASNVTGTINDVKCAARRARAAGALVYIDAVQYAPHALIDVQDLGCDFLVCSGYKFFGPHLGGLWGRRALLETLTPYKVRPAPDTVPEKFETGTQSHEAIAGLLGAIDYLTWIGEVMGGATGERREKLRAAFALLLAHEMELTRDLISGLERLPGVEVQGVRDPARFAWRVPTVSFISASRSPNEIARALAKRNIFVWAGHNYAIELVGRLGHLERGGVVRIGIAHYNSADEIAQLLTALKEIL